MTVLSRLRLRPYLDFDKTEMSLGPRRWPSIRFGPAVIQTLAIDRAGLATPAWLRFVLQDRLSAIVNPEVFFGAAGNRARFLRAAATLA
jgi:hypothetical protein